jgi:hypothetical protein
LCRCNGYFNRSSILLNIPYCLDGALDRFSFLFFDIPRDIKWMVYANGRKMEATMFSLATRDCLSTKHHLGAGMVESDAAIRH